MVVPVPCPLRTEGKECYFDDKFDDKATNQSRTKTSTNLGRKTIATPDKLNGESLLLSDQGDVLLSDFGIAVLALSSRIHNVQEVAGTAAYMAPEQIKGKAEYARDQYALGIVLYEWLAGERPFQGSLTELYAKHHLTPPPSLRARVPDPSPAVEAVVLTALAKDPRERFASLRAFATAFEQACREPAMLPVRSGALPDVLAPTTPAVLVPMSQPGDSIFFALTQPIPAAGHHPPPLPVPGSGPSLLVQPTRISSPAPAEPFAPTEPEAAESATMPPSMLLQE